jgi:hypothetical protein
MSSFFGGAGWRLIVVEQRHFETSSTSNMKAVAGRAHSLLRHGDETQAQGAFEVHDHAASSFQRGLHA